MKINREMENKNNTEERTRITATGYAKVDSFVYRVPVYECSVYPMADECSAILVRTHCKRQMRNCSSVSVYRLPVPNKRIISFAYSANIRIINQESTSTQAQGMQLQLPSYLNLHIPNRYANYILLTLTTTRVYL